MRRWLVVLALCGAAHAHAQPPRPVARRTDEEPAAAPALGWTRHLAGPRARAALGSPSLEERIEAATRLGRAGDPSRAVDALLRRLAEEEDPRARAALLDALARRGDPSAIAPIAAALTEGASMDWAREDRALGLRAIGAIGGERAARVLADWLSTADVAEPAAQGLVRIGPPAVPHLVRALGVPSASARAAVALGRIGDARAVEPLVEHLASALPNARPALLRALGAIGDERAAPTLAGALEDPDPAAVEAALGALARVGGAEHGAAVAPLADRGTVEQRAAALGTLTRLDPAAAAPRLAAVLADDASPPILRAAALDALLANPSEALQPNLQGLLGVAAHRRAAAEALSRVPGEPATRALLGAARSERALDPALALALRRGRVEGRLRDEARRHLAADGSARGLWSAALARDPGVWRRVIEGLAAPDPSGRAVAALAAQLLGSRDARDALARALVAETDPIAFRALAQAALAASVELDPSAIEAWTWEAETAPEALWIAAAQRERASPRARSRLRRDACCARRRCASAPAPRSRSPSPEIAARAARSPRPSTTSTTPSGSPSRAPSSRSPIPRPKTRCAHARGSSPTSACAAPCATPRARRQVARRRRRASAATCCTLASPPRRASRPATRCSRSTCSCPTAAGCARSRSPEASCWYRICPTSRRRCSPASRREPRGLAERPGASQSLLVHRALALSALASLASACAPSADDPLSQLTTWEAPTGDYRVRYLAPPWRVVREDLVGAHLSIESTAMATGTIEGGPGKFDLTTARMGRAIEDEMDREVRASRAMRGRTILDGPRTITTREGVDGLELLTFDEPDPFERYRRVVLFPLGGGQSLRLDFEASPDLDSREVTEMIRYVGIGPRR
ncbi:MAG: HEAT repeat domain-containing protein [Sandaracinaceae bacterium]|nr:HEAT repeat domain-containing protein [Sandaracinaceae bacterium]